MLYIISVLSDKEEKSMREYLIKAFDKTTKKVITFNRALYDNNLESAKKFARHIKEVASEAYKNIKVVYSEYELVSRKEFDI